jgi:hypothetical protein
MKTTNVMKNLAIMLISAILFTACDAGNMEQNEDEVLIVEDEILIVKVFIDEPATVQKSCFDHVGKRVEVFYFELETKYPELRLPMIVPIGEIPEQYRKEGMIVRISGNVTNSLVYGCSEPHIRLAPANLFQLTSIKAN